MILCDSQDLAKLPNRRHPNFLLIDIFKPLIETVDLWHFHESQVVNRDRVKHLLIDLVEVIICKVILEDLLKTVLVVYISEHRLGQYALHQVRVDLFRSRDCQLLLVVEVLFIAVPEVVVPDSLLFIASVESEFQDELRSFDFVDRYFFHVNMWLLDEQGNYLELNDVQVITLSEDDVFHTDGRDLYLVLLGVILVFEPLHLELVHSEALLELIVDADLEILGEEFGYLTFENIGVDPNV